eukprot:scaffold1.g5537.t1
MLLLEGGGDRSGSVAQAGQCDADCCIPARMGAGARAGRRAGGDGPLSPGHPACSMPLGLSPATPFSPAARRAADAGCSGHPLLPQLLANPNYLNWLAQSSFLKDPALLSYLEYLHYWARPEYARFLIYPQALQMLRLLQHEEFRAALASPHYKELLHSQQFYQWLHAGKVEAAAGGEGARAALDAAGQAAAQATQQLQQPAGGGGGPS